MSLKSTACLAATLAFATPAFGQDAPKEEPTEAPAMDLSGIEAVLPTNPELRAAITLALTKVAALGLPLEYEKGERPGSVILKSVPNAHLKAVTEAINATPQTKGGVGCVSFVVVPDTDVPPAEYEGPYDMGAQCGIGLVY